MLLQEIITLARQGHPIAIGTLLNYLMRSQGIKTRVQRQDHCLHVLLEAKQPLNQDKAVAFVQSSVRVLNVNTVQTIIVYSRQQGKSNLGWQQVVQLRSPADSSPAESAESAAEPSFEPLPPSSSSPHSSPADLPLSPSPPSRRDAVTQASNFSPESLEPAPLASIESPAASETDETAMIEAPIAESPFTLDGLPIDEPIDEPLKASPAVSARDEQSSQAAPAAGSEETPEVLKRPESVIFLLFISLFLFWDAYVEFLEDSFSPESAVISASQLARRLKVSRKTIRRRKREAGFAAWTQSLDPDGLAWTYRKGYYLSQP